MAKSTRQRVAETAAVTLVVSVSIAVWLAPMLSCGCEKAAQSQSLNSVKQLALAAIQYAQDHDERLPGWVTLPDGRPAHNTWDEQLAPYIKSKDIFDTGAGPGIRSYSDPARRRVLSYGLNGLLVTQARKSFDGRADFRRPPAEPPALVRFSQPWEIILFAELSTQKPMAGRFGWAPEPASDAFGPVATEAGDAWKRAHDGWIDISPRDFVENTPAPDCYDERRWDATNGIARDLYSGGGTYAFLDGHVKFMKIADGLGARDGVPVERYWSAGNHFNLWNPNR